MLLLMKNLVVKLNTRLIKKLVYKEIKFSEFDCHINRFKTQKMKIQDFRNNKNLFKVYIEIKAIA